MSWLALLLVSVAARAAEPCVFPAAAKVVLAEPIGDDVVLVAEETSRCWYKVELGTTKVFASAAWQAAPSDVKYHRASGRILYYSAEAFGLRSMDVGLSDDRLEIKSGEGPVCQETVVGEVTAKSCVRSGGVAYRILVSDAFVALVDGATLFVAPAVFPLRFKGLVASQKFFVQSVDWDPVSHRLWVLRNEPAGESILEWATLGKGPRVLLALPPISLYTSGIRRLYPVAGRGAVLLDSGKIHSESDFSQVGDLGQRFDEAYFLSSGLLTIRAEAEDLFKVVAYDSHYRPQSFEYLRTRPLRLVEGVKGLVAIMPSGSLPEIFPPLILRKP